MMFDMYAELHNDLKQSGSSERNIDITYDYIRGMKKSELARAYELSPSRISMIICNTLVRMMRKTGYPLEG